MKKIMITVAVVATFALTSCETKTCVCYESVGGKWTKTETIADAAERCGNLSTNTRKCVESYEEDIDPSAIGSDYKRQSVDKSNRQNVER